jgi:phenylacetate-CoA ligase
MVAIRTWLSRNFFIPWIILGPWTESRRKYRAFVREAHAGFGAWSNARAEERPSLVLTELRTVVRWAGEKVPYYRELFRNVGFDPKADFSFADYRRLPTLDKKTIIDRVEDFVAEGFSRDKMRPNSTAGSTGVRVRFWLDECATAWRSVQSEWAFSKVGYNTGDRTGMLWGVPTGPLSKNKVRTQLSDWLAHRQSHDCYHLSDHLLDKIDTRMSAYKPEFLWCYTSPLALLAHRLRDRGKRPSYPKRGIITGAEKLDPIQRQVIEEVFRVPVHESYGSRDCGLIAMQLDPSNPRLHVAGANIMVEPYGESDSETGSEVIVTDLHRIGMPFLRYRLGDRAKFPQFGSEVPTQFLEQIVGRTVDFVSLPDGSTIHGVKFPSIFGNFDVREFQVRQAASSDVQINLVAGPQFTADQMSSIEQMLRDNLRGLSVSLSCVSRIDRTAAGKIRLVVSEYQPAQPSA